jgi:putative endonuclease
VPARTSQRKPRHPSELRAEAWYRRRGYRVLDANAWIGGYELDLVVRRGRTIAFCEVKSKSGEGFGDPLEMVTAEKARRVMRAADFWMIDHPRLWGLEIRFDVIVERAGQIEHIAGAF